MPRSCEENRAIVLPDLQRELTEYMYLHSFVVSPATCERSGHLDTATSSSSRLKMETAMNQLRAWYRDNVADDPAGLHLTDPPHFLSEEEVKLKTGVEYEFIADTEDQTQLDKLREGCSHYDWLDFSKATGTDFEEKRLKFAQEHLHADPEKRLITDGGGYFEVRDQDDRWIRLHLKKGDLITLPAGIYHRLYLDNKDYVKMLRLYTETNEWVALNRGPDADQHPVRAQYLNSLRDNIISVQ